MFKGFENYPHDPQRGDDLIASPILYSLNPTSNPEEYLKGRIFRLLSENVIVDLPHPDFSMPFNIMALTMAIIGFMYTGLYHSIFQRGDAKPKQFSLAQSLFAKLKTKFRGNKNKKEPNHFKTE